MNVMLKSQYDQYRNYQDSLDLIQMKYHDLKHQITGLRAESDEEKRKKNGLILWKRKSLLLKI